MRNIVSPLDGFGSPFGRRGLSKYAIGNFDPALVADFDDEYYRANRQKTTFDGLLTHSRLSNATMVDSDGLLKWGPHNLLTYSEDLTNAVWILDGVTKTTSVLTEDTSAGVHYVRQAVSYTGKLTLSVEVSDVTNDIVWMYVNTSGQALVYFNVTTGSVGTASGSLSPVASIVPLEGGKYLCSVTVTATATNVGFGLTDGTETISYTGDETSSGKFENVRVYRSDLGGMVNNPDRGDSYVPTTSSAVYLPRRGHHVWNGSAWVNEGLLHESETRTNLIEYSEELENAYFAKVGLSVSANAAIAPDGNTTAEKVEFNTTTPVNARTYETSGIALTAAPHVVTYRLKAEEVRWVLLRFDVGGFFKGAYFDLLGGVVGTVDSGYTAYIKHVDNGWYDCSISVTTTAATYYTGVHPAYTDGATPTTATIGDGLYVWGMQLEAGSTPSSYIPTSGATVNRTPDILTIPSANLPWPSPKVIGPELVTNGTFDSDVSGWSAVGATVTWESGELKTVSASGGEGTQQQPGFEIGKVYQATADLRTLAGAAVSLRVVNVTNTGFVAIGEEVTSSSPTSVSVIWKCAQVGEYIYIRNNNAGTAYADNISVREIDPLAVSIQMDGRVTFADTNVASSVDGGVGEAVFSLWKSSSSNYIESVLDTDNGTGMASFIQEASGTRDPVSSTGSYFTPGTLVPYNIASRHGSTFINGAVDGTSLTADLTPVALPDLSSTNLSLAYDYMGCIRQFRVWANDLGDSGIAEASEGEPSSYLIWDASADTYIQKVYD